MSTTSKETSKSEITPIEALNALFNMAKRTNDLKELELAIKCYRGLVTMLSGYPEKAEKEIAFEKPGGTTEPVKN